MPIPLKSVSHADTGASGGIARVGLETRAGANPHRSAPVKVRVAGAFFSPHALFFSRRSRRFRARSGATRATRVDKKKLSSLNFVFA
jgi:hypothetical protein